MAELRVFLDANVLFTAAYSPEGLSALIIEVGVAGRITLLTSPLAVIEARRNLEAKRPQALPVFEQNLAEIEVAAEPGPLDVERLTPASLAAKDRPLLASAIVARATHFVTGDEHDFGPWMTRPGSLPLRLMTPRQFLTERRPQPSPIPVRVGASRDTPDCHGARVQVVPSGQRATAREERRACQV